MAITAAPMRSPDEVNLAAAADRTRRVAAVHVEQVLPEKPMNRFLGTPDGEPDVSTHLEGSMKKAAKIVIATVGGLFTLIALIGLLGSSMQTVQTGQAKHETSPTTATTNATPPPPATTTPPPVVTTTETKPAVPIEHKSALKQAESYANLMHMSKRGVYDQLTSEHGEKFSAAAAQYAVDNVKVDWNAQALASAKSYQNNMHMSPAAIHDQLTSEYGEKFTQAEADYALAHLDD
ncbi:Ltp family lipoprotein [Lentzea aerocolonigenes]|uniref:Ltp family lipoprotein n=1 Tax=Lentzea aerocolonigenes TaxID=68170 RepID=UPI00191C63FB|nr:Ltp family lipoprotein [Lentzea aerocolonigenes]